MRRTAVQRLRTVCQMTRYVFKFGLSLEPRASLCPLWGPWSDRGLITPPLDARSFAVPFAFMKRSQDTFTPPSQKKPKVSDDADAAWSRVERRKAKKDRKREAKHDVGHFRLLAWPKCDVVLQALMPRFMYVNSEIVKRRDAIHIDVSASLTVHVVS